MLLVLAVLTAGCAADDHHPPAGPGGGGTGGMGGDGDDDDATGGDGGAQLTGRLCRAIDLRDPLECPNVNLGGIDVSVGAVSDVTNDDGEFGLDVAGDEPQVVSIGLTADVERAAICQTDVWTDEDGLVAPTVSVDDWEDLVVSIGAVEPDNSATIALYIFDENGSVSGAEVQPPVGTGDAPYYDGDTPGEWSQAGLTGNFGAALLFDVPAISQTVDVRVFVDGQSYLGTVPVRSERLTFARGFLVDPE